jgi:hypothetical protein
MLLGALALLGFTVSGAVARADDCTTEWDEYHRCYEESCWFDDGYSYFSRSCEDGSGEFDDNDGFCEWDGEGNTSHCSYES